MAESELPTCIEGFLAADECRAVIGAIEAGRQDQVEVWLGDAFGEDPDNRSGKIATLPAAAEQRLQLRVWDAIDDLERRYSCAIAELSGITALIYDRGDHFAAHTDGGFDDGAPDDVRRRRVSLVLALNDGARDFAGGELEFAPDPAAGAEAIRVRFRAGMLIAFPSRMVHRVLPVLSGRRYSLALWALAAP